MEERETGRWVHFRLGEAEISEYAAPLPVLLREWLPIAHLNAPGFSRDCAAARTMPVGTPWYSVARQHARPTDQTDIHPVPDRHPRLSSAPSEQGVAAIAENV